MRANRKLLSPEVTSHTRGLIDILAFRVPVQIRVSGFCARALAPWKICCVVVLLWFSRANVVNWNSGVLDCQPPTEIQEPMEKQSDSFLKERNASDIPDNEMQVVVNLQHLNQYRKSSN